MSLPSHLDSAADTDTASSVYYHYYGNRFQYRPLGKYAERTRVCVYCTPLITFRVTPSHDPFSPAEHAIAIYFLVFRINLDLNDY